MHNVHYYYPQVTKTGTCLQTLLKFKNNPTKILAAFLQLLSEDVRADTHTDMAKLRRAPS
jgi:hypothetical protein